MTLSTVTPAFLDDHSVISGTNLDVWRTEIADAIDGTAGGSYAPAAPIDVTGSGFGTVKVVTLSEVAVGGQRAFADGADITDVDEQTFTLAQGQVREFVTPVAQRDHDLSLTSAVPGSWIHFIRPATGNFPIIIHRSGFLGGAIVTLPNLTWSTATVYVDVAGVWRLRNHAFATPGADA